MEFKTFTIHTNKYGDTFDIAIDDWENAPDPICMSLITEEEWNKVGKMLQDEYRSYTDLTEDLIDQIWADYETFVVNYCTCFYYEDMTNEEYEMFKLRSNKGDNEGVLEILISAYKRIKNVKD